ncbi:MAG TPA: DUF3488 and transglutaminase-like domain-containing protein [Tepidisphaeraceae bacterium]|nr:DUF3488 and transglutaminase-like domain-containing protein [Tepidisphaeraceae bacterium]
MLVFRQFKPSLYMLVILSITGFAIASESPAVFVFGVGTTLLNLWWIRSGTFKPLPRWIANTITVVSVVTLAWIVKLGVATPILIIGYFLVVLQIVKLYEQRANRDYAQLMVLGPLLIVAGAISTYSLVFGLIFIVYLFLWLHCCLLFHLKVEMDNARRTMSMPLHIQDAGHDPALKFQKDQRRRAGSALRRSMRGLTAFISVFAISSAIITFLLFPRGPGGIFASFDWKPSQALTGFSDSVSFQNVAMIAQNPQPVATVKVTRANGEPYNDLLILRGTTLDFYTGKGEESGNGAFQWKRSVHDAVSYEFKAKQNRVVGESARPSTALRQQIKLDPTGTNVLFSMAGAYSITPERASMIRYTRWDEVLQRADPVLDTVLYEVVSSGVLTADPWPLPERTPAEKDYLSRIDPKILAFARQAEVSGSDDQGPLVNRRPVDQRVTPNDTTIAHNIETYLRSNFAYTLDLTDATRIIKGTDPLVAFLYDLKRGHCEYFAGAMTLMCQSLGMEARMVVGFRCDEYNTFGSWYTVRQSHAHAWVEVLGDDGTWHTYDPTSSREATVARADSLWQRARALFSFLEYTWANNVVAYDPSKRYNLLEAVDQRLTRGANQGGHAINQYMRQFQDIQSRWLNGPVAWMAAAAIAAIILAIAGRTIWNRLKSSKRIREFNLAKLPPEQRARLVEQLRFYDELLNVLERHHIRRPTHLTPLEFSRTLDFLPYEAFSAIREMTETLYRVRYGQIDLGHEEQQGLVDIVNRIAPLISPHS